MRDGSLVCSKLRSMIGLNLHNIEGRMSPDSEKFSWADYYKETSAASAHRTLTTALDMFAREGVKPGVAIDLGAGDGRDSLELLRRGWNVIAVDVQYSAIQFIRNRVPPEVEDQIEYRVASFVDTDFPNSQLINAGLSLPFCAAEHLAPVMHKISRSLMPGGRFCGHLFGVNDDWKDSPRIAVVTKAEVHDLLLDFNLEVLLEQEQDFETVTGQMKHWHIFHIVAQKN